MALALILHPPDLGIYRTPAGTIFKFRAVTERDPRLSQRRRPLPGAPLSRPTILPGVRVTSVDADRAYGRHQAGLSQTDRSSPVAWVEDLHSASANLLIALIIFHVIGVVLSSLMHGENLVRAMVTGRKPLVPSQETEGQTAP